MHKKVLGKGLEALIPGSSALPTGGGERGLSVRVDAIDANPFQPRKHFNDERLKELSSSIHEDGVLQPIVVRRRGERYQLIMGERRLQAARLAGIEEIPVVIRNVGDKDSLRLALVENIQRDNLNAVEVGHAYRQLVAEFGMSQQELAQLVGKDRSSVANTLRLLNLPEEVQQMIVEEKISGGHARALLSLPTQKEQLAMARRTVEENLSVRQVEAECGLLRRPKDDADIAARDRREKPAYLADLEKSIGSHLGTKVVIDEKRGGRGRIAIDFYSHDDFERLAALMRIPLPR